jgi:choline dehydrogenase
MTVDSAIGQGQWDHIVVGAGSAGCAMAARLSAAGRRVLLLESGGPDRGRWLRIPLGVGRITRDPHLVWQFETEPEAGAGGRRLYWPRGRVLGGSSSVNGMIWVRGDPARWDAWADSGCPGWDWKTIAPHMQAIEDYQAGDPAVRGCGGPIAVEELGGRDPVTDAFIAACVALGIPANPDYNGAVHEGVGRLQTSTRRGVRCSTSVAYLRPAAARPTLRVVPNAHVRRVLFEGRLAVGVEYEHEGALQRARAGREVILAADAIQSPQLLELSGVGQAERLGRLGIPVVANLQGVGENLSDHFHIRASWRARGTVTVNDLLRRPWLHAPPAWLEYWLRGTGLFAGATATVHALARTLPDLQRPDMKLQLHKISSGDRTADTPCRLKKSSLPPAPPQPSASRPIAP